MTTATATEFSLPFVKTIGMINSVSKGRGFLQPYALAVGSDDRIFVVGHNLVRIVVCNMDEDYLGEFATWYGEGEGDQQIQVPTDIVANSKDELHVVDEGKHVIHVYDTEGNYVRVWGEMGDGEGQWNSPSGIAFDADDNTYVVDQHTHRVQMYSNKGKFLTQWGELGEAEGQFNMPWGIVTDSQGGVYVADWRNDRIQKFAPDGEFIASFGSSGEGDGELNRPSTLAVDKHGNMYIADWGNERVQVFDGEGNFLLKMRGDSTLTKWTEAFFKSNVDEAETRAKANLYPKLPPELDTPYHQSSQIEPYFWGLSGMTIDHNGYLYVVEYRRHRFQVYQTPE